MYRDNNLGVHLKTKGSCFTFISLFILTACSPLPGNNSLSPTPPSVSSPDSAAHTLEGVIQTPEGEALEGIKVRFLNHQTNQTSADSKTDSKGHFKITSSNNSSSRSKKILELIGPQGTGKWVLSENDLKQPLQLTYPVKTTATFLHFNDAHGAIDNFPKMHSIIQNFKSTRPNVFVFNAGDNFSGNPVVDLYPEKGKPMIDLSNLLSVDAMAMGNHDFDFGQSVLADRFREAKFPVLCANALVNSKALIPPFLPSMTLKTENDLNVGVFSVIETETNDLPATNPSNIENIEFKNAIQTAAQLVPELKSQNNAVLGLTHIGFDKDKELAQKVDGIDVIIGSHSHTLLKKPKYSNQTLILQAGSGAKYLGVLELTFQNDRVDTKAGKIIEITDSTPSDPTLQAKVDEYNNNPFLQTVIANTAQPIKGKDELGSLITDAAIKILQIDIAFINNGGIRIPEIPAGPITNKIVYQLLPFANDIVKVSMTTQEIRSLLEFSFKKKNDLDLQVGGIQYVVYTRNGKFDHVELLDLSGRPLLEDRLFVVGFNNYIFTTYEFKHSDPGVSTQMADNEALIQYLKSGGNTLYSGVKRAREKKLD